MSTSPLSQRWCLPENQQVKQDVVKSHGYTCYSSIKNTLKLPFYKQCEQQILSVESSLLMGDQCLWLLWVTLAHGFISSRM